MEWSPLTDSRSFSDRRLWNEIPAAAFWALLVFVISGLAFVFGALRDPWMGIAIVMAPALIIALFLKPVRSRLKLSVFRVVTGLVAAMVLYGGTLLGVAALIRLWPEWQVYTSKIYMWGNGHSPLFLLATLFMIVLAEELLWRGVVARFCMERLGRNVGIVVAALIYAAAHLATLNPLLLAAAFGCGLYWGWLYAATDNLVAPVVSHLLWDVTLLFIFPV